MSVGALRETLRARLEISPDAGSFRDRNNRVFRAGDKIFRGISEAAHDNWSAVSATSFFKALTAEGKIVRTTDITGETQARTGDLSSWPAVLAHETVPFISYPYEWSFGMLKDAALLHLEILERAIPEGWTLKDSSAYNIQFVGARPVFIDIPSFEPYRAGDPWGGYRQFCMMFLYPLMVKAYLGVDFGPLMRAYLDGIDPALANKLLWRAARFKKGVISHVYLHSKMQANASGKELDEARRRTEDAGDAAEGSEPERKNHLRHSQAMVLGLIEGLHSTIAKMKSPDERTVWGDYDADHSYSDASHQKKKDFIAQRAATGGYRKIWDIGCNTGVFSRLCAPFADQVISIDGDAKAIDRLYQHEKAEGAGKILPMIVDLGNVSPNQGWRGAERKSLEGRGRPDLILCLALIHHIVISANIPMGEFIDWLADLGGDLIIEFVTAEDAMSKMLLRNKADQYQDYTLEEFERLISVRFEIAGSEELKGGHRKIYFLRRR